MDTVVYYFPRKQQAEAALAALKKQQTYHMVADATYRILKVKGRRQHCLWMVNGSDKQNVVAAARAFIAGMVYMSLGGTLQ